MALACARLSDLLLGLIKRPAFLVCLFGCLLTFHTRVSSSSLAAAEPALKLRSLALVETSDNTASEKAAVAQAVASHLSTGLGGRMNAKEILVIGTYGTELRLDRFFPLVWDQASALSLADQIGTALFEFSFSGEARPDHALSALSPAIAQTGDLLIVLFASSKTPVAGTPFDQNINSATRQLANRSGKQNQIVIISLIARSGRIVRWTVEPVKSTHSLSPAPQTRAAVQRGTPPARVAAADQERPLAAPLPEDVPPPPAELEEQSETSAIPQLERVTDASPSLSSAEPGADPAATSAEFAKTEPEQAPEPDTKTAEEDQAAAARNNPLPEVSAAEPSTADVHAHLKEPAHAAPPPAVTLTVDNRDPHAQPPEISLIEPAMNKELQAATVSDETATGSLNPPAMPVSPPEAPQTLAVLPEPAPGAWQFYLPGFALLFCGMIGLWLWKRSASSAERSSLISRSLKP
jgi:hypothetical protein